MGTHKGKKGRAALAGAAAMMVGASGLIASIALPAASAATPTSFISSIGDDDTRAGFYSSAPLTISKDGLELGSLRTLKYLSTDAETLGRPATPVNLAATLDGVNIQLAPDNNNLGDTYLHLLLDVVDSNDDIITVDVYSESGFTDNAGTWEIPTEYKIDALAVSEAQTAIDAAETLDEIEGAGFLPLSDILDAAAAAGDLHLRGFAIEPGDDSIVKSITFDNTQFVFRKAPEAGKPGDIAVAAYTEESNKDCVAHTVDVTSYEAATQTHLYDWNTNQWVIDPLFGQPHSTKTVTMTAAQWTECGDQTTRHITSLGEDPTQDALGWVSPNDTSHAWIDNAGLHLKDWAAATDRLSNWSIQGPAVTAAGIAATLNEAHPVFSSGAADTELTFNIGANDYITLVLEPGASTWKLGFTSTNLTSDLDGSTATQWANAIAPKGAITIDSLNIRLYTGENAVITQVGFRGFTYLFTNAGPKPAQPNPLLVPGSVDEAQNCPSRTVTVTTIPDGLRPYLFDTQSWTWQPDLTWEAPTAVQTVRVMNSAEAGVCSGTNPPPTTAPPTSTPTGTPTPTPTPTPSGPQAEVNPGGKNTVAAASVALGAAFEVTGKDFKPNETIRIELHSDPVNLGTLTANGVGNLDGYVFIPGSTPVGVHHIVLIDSSGVTYQSGDITVDPTLSSYDPTAPAGLDYEGGEGGNGSGGIPGLGFNGGGLFGLSVIVFLAGALLVASTPIRRKFSKDYVAV